MCCEVHWIKKKKKKIQRMLISVLSYNLLFYCPFCQCICLSLSFVKYLGIIIYSEKNKSGGNVLTPTLINVLSFVKDKENPQVTKDECRSWISIPSWKIRFLNKHCGHLFEENTINIIHSDLMKYNVHIFFFFIIILGFHPD